LTYPDVAEAVSSLSNVTQGAHAIELRVDLLKTIDHDFVRQQIAHLRRHSSLPIIFTVRSATEGGQFKGSDGEYQALVGLARALAVEFIDIEAAKSHLITQVVRNQLFIFCYCYFVFPLAILINSFVELVQGVSKIISSQHNFNERSSRPLIRKMLSACSKVSICDIVKVVGMAGEANDSIELQDEVTRAKSTIHKPIIALLAGAPGKLSRVLNTFLTPVTHETLPFKAAPGL
jgi:pentafunctional AROM polypeptide